MAQLRYANLVPLGRCPVTAAGSPGQLYYNCGPLGGQTAAPGSNAGVPGTAIQQFTLQAGNNSGNLYLLPRGKTAAGNPEAIMAILFPTGSITFPAGLGGPGLLPENLVMDTDAVSGTQYFYGYGVLVG